MRLFDNTKAKNKQASGDSAGGTNQTTPNTDRKDNDMTTDTKTDDKNNRNEHIAKIRSNLKSRIFGQDEVIDLVLSVLLAGGNMIFNDLPGTAKTMLVRHLSECISGSSFGRVQFTPDLMPHDLTGGVQLIGNGEFKEVDGPMFVNFFLGDEINRAAPKTQSALLEAMAERQVTRIGQDGVSHAHKLPDPYATFATQNPLDQQGTFPLPEAQLDRFMVMLSMQRMSRADRTRMKVEKRKLNKNGCTPFDEDTLVSIDELMKLMKRAASVLVDPKLDEWMSDTCYTSGEHEALRADISPRGELQWMELAMAYEVVTTDGRELTHDSLVKVAPYVFGHRLYLTDAAAMGSVEAKQIAAEIVQTIPAPEMEGS